MGIVSIIVWENLNRTGVQSSQTVLGETSKSVPSQSTKPIQMHFDTIVSPINDTVVLTPTHAAPSPVTYDIALVSAPSQLMEGDTATFTWYIQGISNTIRTTAVYFGMTNAPGVLSTTIRPIDTPYTDSTKDFSAGAYHIPLQFIGNVTVRSPGTYYYRAYALIDDKHYWSEERSFVVTQVPRHEVKIINPSTTTHVGENISFTWDVYGPSSTTWYSVIVGGKQSKPEELDATVNLSMTPYAVIVNEFTVGPYAVPLRFIGNAKIVDPGIYYFRALSFINGKNIWSREYSFSAE